MGDPFKLIIEDDDGNRNVVPVDLGEVTIGRHDGNAIRLNERNVSRQHMRLVKESGNVFVDDLDSYNGVYVNGTRITQRAPLHEGDLIQVGDFHLELRGEGLTRRAEETTQKTLVPDLDSTQPEIHMKDGADSRASTGPVRADERPPVPAADDAKAEPTAIIRLDQLQDLQGQKTSSALTGDRPRLIVVSTQLAGTEYEITKTEAVIGRTEDNDIQIDHRSVSRHHAKIVTSGTSYKIVDMNSANGTLVNNEQYAQLALKSGDLIELGHVKLRFVPPGDSYTFSSDERAAMQGKERRTQDDIPTRVQGAALMSAVKRNPLIAVGAAGAVLMVALLFVWMFSGTGDTEGDLSAESIDAIGGAGATPEVVASFVKKAKEFMAEQQWRKAEKLLQLALEKDPDHAPAIDLLETIEIEKKAKRSFDNAKAAVKISKWNDANNALSEIPEESFYFRESELLRAQVRPALVNEKINEASDLINGGKAEDARDTLEEAAALDPGNEQVQKLLEQTGSSAVASAEGRDGSRRNGGRNTLKAPAPVEGSGSKPPKGGKGGRDKEPKEVATSVEEKEERPKEKPKATEDAPAPKAADDGEDAKSLYKKGTAALGAGQADAAISAFNKCVQVDRTYCLCYRALGIAYARAANGPKAARYYRLYLKFCPTAKDAEQVEKLLENYGQ